MAAGSPFATFLIIGPTCFFLGILFAMFPYDYYVLWATPPAEAITSTDPDGLALYFSLLETHLRFMHASPPLINRILHIAIGTGIIGILLKLYKPSEANMLFDGATLVLYMCGVTVYIANIVKGLRVVTQGTYGAIVDGEPTLTLADEGLNDGQPIGREDSLRVLAASNTILALLLVGVLVLQAGQWYAQKKEAAEIAEMDKIALEKKKNAAQQQQQQQDKKGSASASGRSSRSPAVERKKQ